MQDDQIQLVPFDANLVAAIDGLVAFAKRNGSKSQVETEHDWQTVVACYRLFCIFYPEHAKLFEAEMKKLKAKQKAHGIGGDKGATVQHQLEVPGKFYEIFKAIFPLQKWDRKFVHRLAKELPQMKAINQDDKF